MLGIDPPLRPFSLPSLLFSLLSPPTLSLSLSFPPWSSDLIEPQMVLLSSSSFMTYPSRSTMFLVHILPKRRREEERGRERQEEWGRVVHFFFFSFYFSLTTWYPSATALLHCFRLLCHLLLLFRHVLSDRYDSFPFIAILSFNLYLLLFYFVLFYFILFHFTLFC